MPGKWAVWQRERKKRASGPEGSKSCRRQARSGPGQKRRPLRGRRAAQGGSGNPGNARGRLADEFFPSLLITPSPNIQVRLRLKACEQPQQPGVYPRRKGLGRAANKVPAAYEKRRLVRRAEVVRTCSQSFSQGDSQGVETGYRATRCRERGVSGPGAGAWPRRAGSESTCLSLRGERLGWRGAKA